MSKTYVIFLANGQSFDVHNVHSVAYTGADGHQKNMMLSDPDGNILAVLSENHHGLLYKRPTEPGEAPRFPVDATAPAPVPQSVQTPAGPLPIQPYPADQQSAFEAERHATNADAAKHYLNGYTQGEQDRALGYRPDMQCHAFPGVDQYWDRQGWGDGYHARGFHVPGR